jgi:hypothetical protein
LFNRDVVPWYARLLVDRVTEPTVVRALSSRASELHEDGDQAVVLPAASRVRTMKQVSDPADAVSDTLVDRMPCQPVGYNSRRPTS